MHVCRVLGKQSMDHILRIGGYEWRGKTNRPDFAVCVSVSALSVLQQIAERRPVVKVYITCGLVIELRDVV